MWIVISNLNDFVFCPVSIYFHSLDSDTDKMMYQDTPQINGTAAHEKSDTGAYSTRRSMLQGIPIYCEKYNLTGKIDTFDCEKGILTERKKKIRRVYDGYVFQLYAQYYSLVEMGYDVREIRLYSMDDNTVYNIDKPENNAEMHSKFEKIIADMETFVPNDFQQTNKSKCTRCIYESLCRS